MRYRLVLLLALLAVFIGGVGALPSQAQDDIPPFVVDVSIDLESIPVAEAESGETIAVLSWKTTALNDNYSITVQDFQINQWVNVLPEDFDPLPAEGSLEVPVRHPLDFGEPRYRVAIVRNGGGIVSEQTISIPYEEPDAPSEIASFTARDASLDINTLAYQNGTVTVAWQVINRAAKVNLEFVQVREDGATIPIEQPRYNRWIPSAGEGPLSPIVPQSSRTLTIQLNLIDFSSGELLDQQSVSVNLTGTLATPTPQPTQRPAPTAAPPSNPDPPADDGGNDGGGNDNPAPPVVSPGAGGGFELGGHVLGYGQVNVMRSAGMTWSKKQLRWRRGEGTGTAAAMINEARANGFKVLLGIVGYKDEMGDYDAYINEYASFLGQVAALGPDAIEVWNEPNIDREWPTGQINGGTYTRMLIASYNAIKAANPNVMVISGAPAPTGFFGGSCGAQGCDDNVFLRQMANAGAAQYMDCAGAHYNEGVIGPDQRSGDPRNSHYSRYFYGMLDLYYNTFRRQVCWTELGYLTGDGWGELPGGFAWASNTTLGQHAEWLGRAAQLSRSSGRVRLMIVWNVDFTDIRGNDPQGGYAIVRPDGSCPACNTLSAAMQ